MTGAVIVGYVVGGVAAPSFIALLSDTPFNLLFPNALSLTHSPSMRTLPPPPTPSFSPSISPSVPPASPPGPPAASTGGGGMTTAAIVAPPLTPAVAPTGGGGMTTAAIVGIVLPLPSPL
ncbi:unnamed protein product [Closterium sp. Naga37s-1]|nr:unnamed protein product [Closterium sp. Naga37s-1]